MDNALEAMPDGGKLDVRATKVELSEAVDGLAPGSYLAVHVTDTGPGMDEVTLVHAFEPFFCRRDSAKHAGLGLATAYAIARRSLGPSRSNRFRAKGRQRHYTSPRR